MIPVHETDNYSRGGAPRVSGDDPPAGRVIHPREQCSPRERG